MEAARVAERAASIEAGWGLVRGLLASGWVALAIGHVEHARERCAEATAAARRMRDSAGLAETLELRAMCDQDRAGRIDALEQALAIWRQIRVPLGEARTELALAQTRRGPTGSSLVAERRLRALGVRPSAAGAAGLLMALGGSRETPVSIEALGSFRVLRRGEQVSLSEWQSKKARDLLKILVARRGHMTPRDYLMETLWPEEDPGRLGNRLSVALATARAVLDPQDGFDPDHFVAADKEAIGVRLDHVAVDVESFLDQARTGLALEKDASADEAFAILKEAEESYAGDFLEEDLYEDWTTPLREEARATYVAVARSLAGASLQAGDHDSVVRYLLRILERDPFDEEAHLGLVIALEGAGRHGEARRQYRLYVSRMEELGVEPAPFPHGPG
jgi:DNA-binding SARP family transcriptional activator